MMLAVVLRQNPSMVELSMNGADKPAVQDVPDEHAAGKKKQTNSEEDDIEAQQRVMMSTIAQKLQSKDYSPENFEEYRERQQYLTELMIRSIEDIDKLLLREGFELHPKNRNELLEIGESDDVPEETQLPFLPPLRRNLRTRPDSDSREPPNIYLELVPMRCTYMIALINFCLELGDFSKARRLLKEDRRIWKGEAVTYSELHDALRTDKNALMNIKTIWQDLEQAPDSIDQGASVGAKGSTEEVQRKHRLRNLDACRRLLKEAETTATRCVYFLPWLHVQLCLLKLRWRRLDLQIGMASCAIEPERTNHVIYCDPKTFGKGVCPPTTSPLFRTFVSRAQAPELVEDTEWVLVGHVNAEGSAERYLKELVATVRIAVQEGGHDYTQLRGLFREGIEEVLRTCLVAETQPESASFDLLHALFACVVASVDTRKALQFDLTGDAPPKADDPKGKPAAATPTAAPPPIATASLPPRIGLDIQAHLKRQANEGALAYSLDALNAAKSNLLFSTVAKHALALRRECDTFFNIFPSDRLLCDQLHVNLSVASADYKKAKIIDDSLLQAIEMPSSSPSTGDVMIQWTTPDPPLRAPPDQCCIFLALICSFGSEQPETAKPIVARSPVLEKVVIRRLLDSLNKDLDHCRPATAMTGEYMEQRLRTIAKDMRGIITPKNNEDVIEAPDAKLDAAVLRILLSLQEADAEPPPVGEDGEALPPSRPELLSASKVQHLLRAFIRLLDVSSHAARVVHPELSTFLRVVLEPMAIFRDAK